MDINDSFKVVRFRTGCVYCKFSLATFGTEASDRFFALFGDTDGDRDVDGHDYGRFGRTFLKSIGTAGYDERLDADQDGDVDGQDYGRFGRNFLKSV